MPPRRVLLFALFLLGFMALCLCLPGQRLIASDEVDQPPARADRPLWVAVVAEEGRMLALSQPLGGTQSQQRAQAPMQQRKPPCPSLKASGQWDANGNVLNAASYPQAVYAAFPPQEEMG